jgi:formate-dependent nitrite reductase membrane component NrfD
VLLATLTHVFDIAAAGATTTASGIPDPGRGTAPPGSDGILTIIKWAAWIAFGVCVLGVIIAGAMMAISSRRGEGGEHMSRLGWVCGGAIIIGSASALVGALA